MTDERAVLYLATGLTHGEAQPDATEALSIRWVPFEEALEMTTDGRITDVMSVLGIERRRPSTAPGGTRPRTVGLTVRREWDVIVVGLGALGSGAAYWASTRAGARVLGLEQFEFGHANGASADHSRIIRLSYHRPDYVRLAKRAYETWAAVEAEADDRIVTVTGGLDLWPADAAIPADDYVDSLTAEDVPFERLDGVRDHGGAGRSGG